MYTASVCVCAYTRCACVHTNTHTHTHTSIYIFIYIVCVDHTYITYIIKKKLYRRYKGGPLEGLSRDVKKEIDTLQDIMGGLKHVYT